MKLKPSLLAIFSIILATLACSLTAEPPPTLAPSTPIGASPTPQPGIEAPTLQVNPNDIKPPSGVQQLPQGNASVNNASSVNQVSADRLMQTINTLVGFESRHILSSPSPTTGVDAARDWLLTELRAIAETSPNDYLQIDVYPQQFRMEWAGREVFPSNVIMAIQGTDASAGVVMVTAHYDTTTRDWFQGDGFQPGANDNASGVSAIIELARIMVQRPHRATIVFVMFSAEETGRQGSQAFVQDFAKAQNIPLVAVLNLDIIGNPEGRLGSRLDNSMRVFSEGPNADSPSRQLARLVAVAADRFVPNMTVAVQDSVERSGRWGDHMSFSSEGYPAVRLIEMEDDPTIAHTTRDTADNIDPEYLKRTTQVALAALEVLVDGPNAPSLRPLSPSPNDPNSLVLEWSHNPTCQSYVVALRQVGSLIYDEYYTVEATSLTWGGFRNFESVTVACVDTEGRLGRFAPELLISN